MKTIDERICAAPADICFQVAADVENWPTILPHYRWVKFQRKDGFAEGIVEMAAWRSFPGFNYPTWWASEMRYDPEHRTVFYRHIAGVTKGMDVEWKVTALEDGRSHLCIVHEWSGPAWPLIGSFAANYVIGPHFVSHIAGRTLHGIAEAAERKAKELKQ